MPAPREERAAGPGGPAADPRGGPATGGPGGAAAGAAGREAAWVRVGRRAWALLGVAGLVALAYLGLSQVSVVATPLVIALFPAAVLWPLRSWATRRGAPRTLTALVLTLLVLGLVALVLWLVVPRFLDQVPDLVGSVGQALTELERRLARLSLPVDIGAGGLAGLAERAVGGGGAAGGAAIDQGLGIAARVTGLLTSTVVFVVALFFYLRDGERLWAGLTSLLPAAGRRHVHRVSGQLGWTLGAYFRGQMVIAVVDGLAIGVGLALIGVPLALPLGLLVFLGAFFPIVGAFVSGLVAVLVALADQGLTTALLALLVVVAVQQAEGNLLEPLVLSPVLKLHPLLIIVAITAGALTYGVLGAFLAVPAVACGGRVVDYLRGRPPAAGPGWHGADGSPQPAG